MQADDTLNQRTSLTHGLRGWQPTLYMASARLRQATAKLALSAFIAGASYIAAARSKCAAASLNSAPERDPKSQTAPPCPLSTVARMACALASFGAALTNLADSALTP